MSDQTLNTIAKRCEKLLADDIKALETEEKFHQRKLLEVRESLSEMRKSHNEIKQEIKRTKVHAV